MLCRGCNTWEGNIRFDAADRLVIDAYRADPPAGAVGWLWDTDGAVAQIMLARARAAGRWRDGISCIADADLRAFGIGSPAVAEYVAELEARDAALMADAFARFRADTWTEDA